MRQFCLWSQPPILISCILLLYCFQAPFWLCICMPASSFAQSAGQAGQLDLLHVLQGFILGVLQEVTLALRTHRQTGRVRDHAHCLGPKARTPLSCLLNCSVPWNVTQVLFQIPSAPPPLPPLVEGTEAPCAARLTREGSSQHTGKGECDGHQTPPLGGNLDCCKEPVTSQEPVPAGKWTLFFHSQ